MTTTRLAEASCEAQLEAARVPLEDEWRWFLEWLSLMASPVYAGIGVPHGDGRPVIVVPGFLGSMAQLRPLTRWLERAGYSVYGPGFAYTASCPDVLLERLERQIAAVAGEGGRPVAIVGHSLGGSLARAAAVREPMLVSQVITLGSPLREVKAHLAVVATARVLAWLVPGRHVAHEGHSHDATCACELSEALAAPFPGGVKRVAIYSRNDGVIDWRTAMEGDPDIDVQVRGSHLGLPVNAAVYETIASALAGDVRSGAPRRKACVR